MKKYSENRNVVNGLGILHGCHKLIYSHGVANPAYYYESMWDKYECDAKKEEGKPITSCNCFTGNGMLSWTQNPFRCPYKNETGTPVHIEFYNKDGTLLQKTPEFIQKLKEYWQSKEKQNIW